MLQGEFETLTGIYLDVPAYEAAEHEYNTGDYASKAEFCDCFKADEDGLATKIQTAANKRWFGLTDQRDRLTAENDRLQKENENLSIEIMKLGEHVDELQKKIDAMPEHGVPKRIMMLATMMQALIAAAMDDNKADTILHQVWAYQYLLDELHEELKDK